MGKILRIATVLTAAMWTAMAFAQSTAVDHLSQGQLMEKAKLLEQAVTSKGSASTKLAEYPRHFTMVALRKKSGGAEIHQQYADFFFVVRGQAMLVTGGAVVDPKTVSPGEIQGTAVKSGTEMQLREGDFVHIPANVPHQLLLPENGDFVYFVIKVQEQ